LPIEAHGCTVTDEYYFLHKLPDILAERVRKVSVYRSLKTKGLRPSQGAPRFTLT